MIKAVSFDIDQTLIDFDTTLKNALAKVAEAISERFSIEISAAELAEIGRQEIDLHEGPNIDFLKLRRQSLERFLRTRRLDTQFAEHAFDIFFEERFRKAIFMEGAVELLNSIPEHIKVCALSNGNSEPDRFGFAEHFDFILTAKDLTYHKPDRRAFEQLLALANIENPESVLHVGDSIAHDVLGARQAGMKTVWFNPDNNDHPDSHLADHNISELAKILDIIT